MTWEGKEKNIIKKNKEEKLDRRIKRKRKKGKGRKDKPWENEGKIKKEQSSIQEN